MEVHATITGPEVGELIRICVNCAIFPSGNAILFLFRVKFTCLLL